MKQISHLQVTADVGVTSAPVINAAGVFSRDGWLIGAAATFDSSSNKLAATSLAFGHSTPQYTLHSFVINSTDFGASLYHKVASNVEVGTQLGWKVNFLKS